MLTRRAFLRLAALLPFLRFPRLVTPAVTERAQAWGFPLAFPAYFLEAQQQPRQMPRRKLLRLFLALING